MTESPVIVARLIPKNDYAQEAFTKLYNKEDVFEKHKAYLVLDASLPEQTPPSSALTSIPSIPDDISQPLQQPVEKTSESTSSDSGDDSSVDGDAPFEEFAGYFRLDFSHLGAHQLHWRIGKGLKKSTAKDRDVDVLVVHYQEPGTGVIGQHVLLRFHPKSGVLMLTGLSNRHPVIFYENFKSIKLGHAESHVLYQQSNHFRIGKLEFLVKFDELAPTAYLDWLTYRNAILHIHRHEPPSRAIQAFPYDGRPLQKLDNFILSSTLGSGAVGWIMAAVHARTGDPVALKELRLRSSSDRVECFKELKIARELKDITGATSIIDSFCEHLKPNGCVIANERFYTVWPLALYGDFSQQDWTNRSYSWIATLIRGPLQGLAAMHDRGYMHRDISLKNVLVESIQPATAVICDFGKAIHSARETNSCIGPFYTLAPEISLHNNAVYTNKIDIWAFGLCCAYVLVGNSRSNVQLSYSSWKHLMEKLDFYAVGKPSEAASLVDLLKSLIQWSPKERYSAKKALSHSFFRLCQTERRKSDLSDSQRPLKMTKQESPCGIDTTDHQALQLKAGIPAGSVVSAEANASVGSSQWSLTQPNDV